MLPKRRRHGVIIIMLVRLYGVQRKNVDQSVDDTEK